jgi:hypothetical protein
VRRLIGACEKVAKRASSLSLVRYRVGPSPCGHGAHCFATASISSRCYSIDAANVSPLKAEEPEEVRRIERKNLETEVASPRTVVRPRAILIFSVQIQIDIHAEHERATTNADRKALLSVHKAVMDAAERQIRAEDLEEFRKVFWGWVELCPIRIRC